MDYIDFDRLQVEFERLHSDFQSKEPFRYLIIENFLKEESANLVLENYPAVEKGKWNGTTYLDQRNKFQLTSFESDSVLEQVFKELNSDKFLEWLERITEIEEPLIGDPKLFGGGLHQSIHGAFLNVHVDYNIHPETKLHRRLNVLVYMNKDWKDEYQGHLELWDLRKGRKELLEKVAPTFNRCVIFETNEISFHGHPVPLNTPRQINRKSLATYYYTKSRPTSEIADDHNTLYVNTGGINGNIKRLKNSMRVMIERLRNK